MALIRRRLRLVLVVAGLLSIAALLEGYVLVRAHRFNAALEHGDLAAAAGHGVEEARIAEAMVLQEGGDWQAALEIYGAVEQTGTPGLRQVARYNMANLYLQRGIEMAAAGSMDLALPLVELAKTAYRAVLRADPGDWDARHNLAKALQVVPDIEVEEVEDDIMPERSQRSLVPIESRRELP